ncbi:MAG: hypothetical protein PHX54_01635 [Lentimicrobiaceae bacterium]|nr:hypothetical protein [Lentimicrobiaceae bacterium]
MPRAKPLGNSVTEKQNEQVNINIHFNDRGVFLFKRKAFKQSSIKNAGLCN